MAEAEEAHTRVRREPVAERRRWDGVAAVIATFIGLLALAVSGYTAYLQRRQLRAQVWPHLEIKYSSVEHRFFVVNQGTGPARVTGMRVTSGGTVIRSWDDALRLAGFTEGEGTTRSSFHQAVLSADKEFTLLHAAEDDASRARFAELFPRRPHALDITVCYCSVLDECWIAGLTEPARDSDGCPIPQAERFKE